MRPGAFSVDGVGPWSGGGGGIRARLADFPHDDWRDRRLSDAELDAADVHVVSPKENRTHVCVPSKAVSALCRGRPILLFGSAESDAWGWADGGGLRIASRREAARRALPEALAQLTVPARLEELAKASTAARLAAVIGQ